MVPYPREPTTSRSTSFAQASARASAVSPFHYSQMIWAVLLGFLVFSELPDLWVAVGSAIIVGSGLFILWRERVVNAARRARG